MTNWKEMQYTNHGGTAWVRKDEAEAFLTSEKEVSSAAEKALYALEPRLHLLEDRLHETEAYRDQWLTAWQQAEAKYERLRENRSEILDSAWNTANERAKELEARCAEQERLLERNREEFEKDAAEHGIPALLDRMGFDGLGNEVVDLYKRIKTLEGDVARLEKQRDRAEKRADSIALIYRDRMNNDDWEVFIAADGEPALRQVDYKKRDAALEARYVELVANNAVLQEALVDFCYGSHQERSCGGCRFWKDFDAPDAHGIRHGCNRQPGVFVTPKTFSCNRWEESSYE